MELCNLLNKYNQKVMKNEGKETKQKNKKNNNNASNTKMGELPEKNEVEILEIEKLHIIEKEEEEFNTNITYCNNQCKICNTKLKDEKIVFTCGHIYCFICFNLPIISYFNLKNIKNNSLFSVINENLNLHCLFCEKGEYSNKAKCILENSKTNLINLQYYLNNNFNDNMKKHSKEIMCSECSSTTNLLYCLTCKETFCEGCDYHKKQKILNNHKRIKLNIEKKENKIIKKLLEENEKFFDYHNKNLHKLESSLSKLKQLNSNLIEIQKEVLDSIETLTKTIEISEYNKQLNDFSMTFIQNIENEFENLEINNDLSAEKIKEVNETEKEFESLNKTVDFLFDATPKLKECLMKIHEKVELNHSNFNLCNSNSTSKETQKNQKKRQLTSLTLAQNIECDGIQIIHRPNVFSIGENNSGQSCLVWPDYNNEIIVYDYHSNEII